MKIANIAICYTSQAASVRFVGTLVTMIDPDAVMDGLKDNQEEIRELLLRVQQHSEDIDDLQERLSKMEDGSLA